MTRTPRRTAFTLVELMVVIAIMILILALGTAVAYSGAFNSQKVVGASDRASGWLVIAKNRAKRDGAPRGVRFLRNPNDPTGTSVTEAQYIEQPEQWAPNPDQEFNPHGPRIIFSHQYDTATGTYGPRLAYFVSFDPTDPNPTSAANILRRSDIQEFLQRITFDDLLLLPEIGGPYRITSFAPPTAAQLLRLNDVTIPGPVPPPVIVPPENCLVLTLAQPTSPQLGAAHSPPVNGTTILNPLGTLMTYKFGFQPKPLPIRGEPLLQLTGTTVIDYRTAPYSAANPQTTLGVTMDPVAGHFDILFSPSGQVLNNSNGLICLWVRDPEKLQGNPRLPNDAAGYDLAGEQILVTIYTRTGFIATHPVSTLFAVGDPWLFAKDGANSGF